MSGPLSWRAIGLGVAVIIATTIALLITGVIAPALIETLGMAFVSWGMRLTGLAGDFAGGFVAGRIAGRDGAVHGVIAGSIGAAVGLLQVMLRMLGAVFELPATYWLQVALWTGLGVALALVGGALGAVAGRR